MRPKTQRAYKRLLHEYALGFGFRTPYQILVDADFCKEAAKQKIDVNVEFQKTFQDPTLHFITECSVQELRRNGGGSFEAQKIAKQFERRRCPHTHAPIASAECVRQVVGPTNEHNYCVASQNESLREQLREIPGIPLVYAKAQMVVMEMMTSKTKQVLKQKESDKLGVSAREKEQINKLLGINEEEAEPKKKKKKVKGPNPLSVKKKKKVAPPPPKKNAELVEKKRKREEDEQPVQQADAKVAESSIPDGGEDKKKRRRRKKTKHDKDEAE